MALAILGFADPAKEQISRKFGAPKKMTLETWFKAARKVIPEIPNPNNTDWMITDEEATKDARWIIFDLANSVGDRCRLKIDRTIPLIG